MRVLGWEQNCQYYCTMDTRNKIVFVASLSCIVVMCIWWSLEQTIYILARVATSSSFRGGGIFMKFHSMKSSCLFNHGTTFRKPWQINFSSHISKNENFTVLKSHVCKCETGLNLRLVPTKVVKWKRHNQTPYTCSRFKISIVLLTYCDVSQIR